MELQSLWTDRCMLLLQEWWPIPKYPNLQHTDVCYWPWYGTSPHLPSQSDALYHPITTDHPSILQLSGCPARLLTLLLNSLHDLGRYEEPLKENFEFRFRLIIRNSWTLNETCSWTTSQYILCIMLAFNKQWVLIMKSEHCIALWADCLITISKGVL